MTSLFYPWKFILLHPLHSFLSQHQLPSLLAITNLFFFFNSIHSLHQITRNRTRGKGSRINSHHLFTRDLCEGKVLIGIVPFIVVDHWFIVFGIIRSPFPAGPNDSRPTLLSCRHRVLQESKAIITTQTNPSTVPAGARHTEWPIKSHPYNWLMLERENSKRLFLLISGLIVKYNH